MELDQDLAAVQEVRALCRRAKEAQEQFRKYSQAQVDAIVEAMARAGFDASVPLAKMAFEETGYGKVEDKIRKNHFASLDVYNSIRETRTVGLIDIDERHRIYKFAEPMGVVAAIVPTTNPTSTVIFKILISVKAGNAVVISPHPRAIKCTRESTRVLIEAGLKAGMPEGLVGCLSRVTVEATNELMRSRETSVILATGGGAMVRAAYSAGKPAYGVGPGNVPVYVDRTADVNKAAADIIMGKNFDHGTLCSSEQSVIADRPIAQQLMEALKEEKAYFMSDEETAKVDDALIIKQPRLAINPELVGHSAWAIAQRAGFSVPQDTTALVARIEGVGREYPLSMEKLSPVLAFFEVEGWEAGAGLCDQVLNFGGRGHTMAMHCKNNDVIRKIGERVPAFRVVVNSASTMGSVGVTNFLMPSFTLGCGTYGNNITSDNISALHLINIKRMAYEITPGTAISIDRPWKVETRHANTASAGSPERPISARRNVDAPYNRALDSGISRKGGESSPSSGDTRKYGSSGITESDIERIVRDFTSQTK